MEPVGIAIVAVLGLIAGLTTTVAGVGGGLVMTLALALLLGPHAALAVTAIPLFLGNGQRLAMYRRHLDRRLIAVLAVGLVPGVIIGTLVVDALSPTALQIVLIAAVVTAVVRELGWITVPAGPRSLIPGGGALGFISASAGAGGLVAGPLVLAAGLRGNAFVATIAAIGVVVNLERVAGYAAADILELAHLPHAALLSVTLIGGNLLGRRIRNHLTETTLHRLTWAVLATGLLLGAAGL